MNYKRVVTNLNYFVRSCFQEALFAIPFFRTDSRSSSYGLEREASSKNACFPGIREYGDDEPILAADERFERYISPDPHDSRHTNNGSPLNIPPSNIFDDLWSLCCMLHYTILYQLISCTVSHNGGLYFAFLLFLLLFALLTHSSLIPVHEPKWVHQVGNICNKFLLWPNIGS